MSVVQERTEKVLTTLRNHRNAGATPNLSEALEAAGIDEPKYKAMRVWMRVRAPAELQDLCDLLGEKMRAPRRSREPDPVEEVEEEPEEMTERDALFGVVSALESYDKQTQARILAGAAVFLGVKGAFFLIEAQKPENQPRENAAASAH